MSTFLGSEQLILGQINKQNYVSMKRSGLIFPNFMVIIEKGTFSWTLVRVSHMS